MDISVLKLGAITPLPGIIFNRKGEPISEYTERLNAIASPCEVSVACDTHFEGILPSAVPNAPTGTVYTKRILYIDQKTQAARQTYCHMNKDEFIKYAEDSTSGDFKQIKENQNILLGGASWQGFVLAKLAVDFFGSSRVEHLIVEDLYPPEIIVKTKKILKQLGCPYEVVRANINPKDRTSMFAAVSGALNNSTTTKDANILDPRSSTFRLAEKLASLSAYVPSHVANATPVLGQLTHKEIEIYGRLVIGNSAISLLSNVRNALRARVSGSVLDVFILSAMALEHFAPGR